MGRADLSRHRKISPSDTKPIATPITAEWTLDIISLHSNTQLRRSIASIRDASTQRAQVAAVKMLGVVLRDAHMMEDDGRGRTLCSCRTSDAQGAREESVCHIAGTWLSGVLFDSPDATPGLVATALRSYLRCREIVQVQVVEECFEKFFAAIEQAADCATAIEPEQLPKLLSILCATTACLSESVTRKLLLSHVERTSGILRNVCRIANVYQRISRHDKTVSLSAAASLETQGCGMYDRTLLDAGVDSGMKAAQDVLNYLARNPVLYCDIGHRHIRQIADACCAVLMLEAAPRSCAMACAVAYVTAVLLLECETWDCPKSIAIVLRRELLSRVPEYPRFSQLSLLRGVMEAPMTRPALGELLFPGDRGMGDTVFEVLASLTSANSDVHMRFLAMEAVISCLRRCSCEQQFSPLCRQIVLDLIYERWQEPFPGVTSQIRESMEALVTVCGDSDAATKHWEDMARSLLNGDWFAKGMYAPLGVLVKRVGAIKLLEVKEDCQILALQAAAVDSRLAKPVSDYLGALWSTLLEECANDQQGFVGHTAAPLVKGLVDVTNKALRERIAEYMLPVYFKVVGKEDVNYYANALLNTLVGLKLDGRGQRIRGTVSIMSVARRNGVFVASFSDPLIFGLLREALLSREEDLRASALDLVVTSRAATEPIKQEEFDLVLSYLPVALMPGGSPTDRSRFRHSMRKFFERLAACRHAALNGSGGWWMKERKKQHGSKRTPEFEEMRLSLLRRIAKFQEQCLAVLMGSCYPGAVFWRRTNALEVATLLSRNLGFGAAFESRGDSAHLIVGGLIDCLLDEWERPRRAALQAISSLIEPVPGIDTFKCASDLQLFALPLLNSPRQKDVDAGALLCRAVFRKYTLGEASGKDRRKPLRFPAHHNANDDTNMFDKYGLGYASSILDALKDAVLKAEEDFSEVCESGLFHGCFLSLRYVLQDVPWKDLLTSEDRSAASAFIQRFVEMTWQCTQIAMRGVSFHAFNGRTKEGDIGGNEDLLDTDNIFLKEKRQFESTSCFLSMKEICISLGILCHEVPFSEASPGRDSIGLLQEHQIKSIGHTYLHVFMNTRHWGVIDGASEGFQLLCERLLQNPGINLRALPKTWILQTLSNALSGELYVLRRSAGIPSLMNAVVNAESTSNNRSHEAPLLNGVMTSLLSHLQSSHLFTDPSIVSSGRSKEEESISHALNLLRSLFLNGNVSSGVLKHFELAAIFCIKAFCSASWLIRNSAMMLFSALVRRGVGACIEKKVEAVISSFSAADGTPATMPGERRLRGATAFQFFSRHPKLHPFLLGILKESISKIDDKDAHDHPALYPSLYLLSCLSPAAAEDPSMSISMKAFRPVLRDCSHWRSEHVRRVAAAASVSMLEDSGQVASVVRHLLSTGVPEEPESVTYHVLKDNDHFDTNQESWRGIALQQNHLHGELLTISAILNGTRCIMSIEDKSNTIQTLVELLPTRLWIACDGMKNACSYTRTAMVSILTTALELTFELDRQHDIEPVVKENMTSMKRLCEEVACGLREIRESECGPGAAIGISYLRHTAAHFVARVSCMPGRTFADMIEMLSKLVCAESRESRLCGFEHCIEAISRFEGGSQVGDDVVKTMRKLWSVAKEQFGNTEDDELRVCCIKLITCIIQFFDTDACMKAELLDTFEKEGLYTVLDIAKGHACVDVMEHGLILLGKLATHTTFSTSILHTWIECIEHATKSQTSTARMAAASSIHKSGIYIYQADDTQERLEVGSRAWLCICKLLEDEHVDVRAHVSAIANECIAAVTGKDVDEVSLGLLASLISIHKILVARYSMCASVLAYICDLVGLAQGDMLTRILCNITCIAQQEICERGDVGEGDDVNVCETRLFKLEDCAEGEAVLRMQLATRCCIDMIHASTYELSRGDLRAVVLRSCGELEESVRDACVQKRPGLIGRDVYTVKGFEDVYRMVMRVVLVAVCVEGAQEDGDGHDVLDVVKASVGKLVEVYGCVLHPVLRGVLENVVCAVADGEWGGVLFLVADSG